MRIIMWSSVNSQHASDCSASHVEAYWLPGLDGTALLGFF